MSLSDYLSVIKIHAILAQVTTNPLLLLEHFEKPESKRFPRIANADSVSQNVLQCSDRSVFKTVFTDDGRNPRKDNIHEGVFYVCIFVIK